jgi:hypothetical protein
MFCCIPNTNMTQQRCQSFLLDIIKSYYRVFVPASHSQWTRGLRRESAAVCLLGLWVQIQSGAWMSVCCECCVLSGRGFCVGLITRTEDLCPVWCVWVWSWSLDNEDALAHNRAVVPFPFINIGFTVVCPAQKVPSVRLSKVVCLWDGKCSYRMCLLYQVTSHGKCHEISRQMQTV